MKVYLYTYAYEKIKKEGYKSLSLFDPQSEHFKKSLLTHRKCAKSNNSEDILNYLRNSFPGRMRSVCVVTEMAPIKEYKHPYLNWLVSHADVISFELRRLIEDEIVESIYCKDLRKTILTNPDFENIYKVNDINELENTKIDWDLCGSEKYISFSPWAAVKHYFLVLKDGYIPPEYITLEVNHSST